VKVEEPEWRKRNPRWEGEAETLTLEAEFQSDYRLRIKVCFKHYASNEGEANFLLAILRIP
jgi:hypothetical protein